MSRAFLASELGDKHHLGGYKYQRSGQAFSSGEPNQLTEQLKKVYPGESRAGGSNTHYLQYRFGAHRRVQPQLGKWGIVSSPPSLANPANFGDTDRTPSPGDGDTKNSLSCRWGDISVLSNTSLSYYFFIISFLTSILIIHAPIIFNVHVTNALIYHPP